MNGQFSIGYKKPVGLQPIKHTSEDHAHIPREYIQKTSHLVRPNIWGDKKIYSSLKDICRMINYLSLIIIVKTGPIFQMSSLPKGPL